MGAMQGESPAVARRRVRLALRRDRQGTGLSQGEVARNLGWSLSKMQRIETGEVTVSGSDLRALLDMYGVTDRDQIDRLLEDSRISRRERWWTAPEYREHLTPGLLQLLQFEAEATTIRVYQPHLIPGMLQTPAVADSVMNWWDENQTGPGRQVRYDVRMLRQQRIIDGDDPPVYLLILDESVIRRNLGGAAVMAEQLEALAAMASRPNVHLRIVALDEGGIVGMVGPFTILSLADDDPDDAVLYRESDIRDSLIHEVDQVRRYRGIFERVWTTVAYQEPASLRLINAQAAVLRSSLDQQR